MKKNCLWGWVVAAGVVAGSNSALAADPAELAKRLHHAAEMSSLDDPALKPWHLKLDVQLYDDKGQPSEKGTIEEWWTPEKDKRVYATPSYSATEIQDGKTLYRSKDQAAAPYMLDAIRRQVVHPMATEEEIDHAKPRLHVQSFGKVNLDCIILDQQLPNISDPPIGLFPTYCLSPDSDQLRIRDRFGSEAAALNSLGTFQDRKVSVYSSIELEGHKAVDAHVTLLEGKAFEPSIFVVGDELAEVPGKQSGDTSKIVPPKVLKFVDAIYPEDASRQKISGKVELGVDIGTDGRVHNLKVLKCPSSSFAWAAMAAVRQYTFAAAKKNGTPVETEVVIQVEFKIY